MRVLNNFLSSLSDTERWRAFLHNRLWLGLPAAAVVSFVILFLLRHYGEGIPVSEALWKGGVYALLIAFCWALGVWASTDRSPSAEQEPEADNGAAPRSVWGRYILTGGLLLVALLLVCGTQVVGMIRGTESFTHGLMGILLKAMAIAAVVIPVWLDSRRM